jgi:hypothetical protein
LGGKPSDGEAVAREIFRLSRRIGPPAILEKPARPRRRFAPPPFNFDRDLEGSAMQKAAIAPPEFDNHQLLAALRAFRKGDFSVRLPMKLTGIDGEIAEAFNDVVELNERMTKEFERLGDVVGKDGKIGQRAKLPYATGSWAANVDAVRRHERNRTRGRNQATVSGYIDPADEWVQRGGVWRQTGSRNPP